jgi:hypothetical protein
VDLHKTLLQSFQGLLLMFNVATEMFADDVAEARKLLESTTAEARNAMIKRREAVYGLRASTVVTDELARAISQVGEELAARPSDGNRSEFRVLVEGTSRDIVPLIHDEITALPARRCATHSGMPMPGVSKWGAVTNRGSCACWFVMMEEVLARKSLLKAGGSDTAVCPACRSAPILCGAS